MADPDGLLVEIRADDARPIYLQIADEIRRAIVVEALEPGEALPSVRELASRLRVNPNTVSRAYRELERDDLVYVRRGTGTFVSPEAKPDRRRKELAREVAERALRDAHRHSLTGAELVDAIRALEREREGGGRGGREGAGAPRAGGSPADGSEGEPAEEPEDEPSEGPESPPEREPEDGREGTTENETPPSDGKETER